MGSGNTDVKGKMGYGHNAAKKYRLSTTISSRHYALFKKHLAEYGSQQAVLEHALESLDDNTKASAPLSTKEEIWLRIGKELKTAVVILPKDILKLLIESTDIQLHKKYTEESRPYEFIIEYFYQKSLKECTLPELIDVIVLCTEFQNSYETINYADNGDHYTLALIHKWGLKYSTCQLIIWESAFESYGARTESHISETGIFTRIYKKGPNARPLTVRAGGHADTD